MTYGQNAPSSKVQIFSAFFFFFFIFITLYLGLVDEEKRHTYMVHQTHHLSYQPHLCSITYMTIKRKTTEQMFPWWGKHDIHELFIQTPLSPGTKHNWVQMWQDDEPLIHPRHRVFFHEKGTSCNLKKKKRKKKENHSKQRVEDKDKHALAPSRNALTLRTLPHNSPVSTQIKNVGMVTWSM